MDQKAVSLYDVSVTRGIEHGAFMDDQGAWIVFLTMIGSILMSRSNTGGSRKPASKFPQLRKQMQKNAITKGLQKTRGHQPKPGGKKQP